MTLSDLRALATIKDGGWHRFESPYQLMSVTLEEAELLYTLVRATRPRNVLELGTGLGLTAAFIATALAENGDSGTLVSIEPNNDLGREAQNLLAGLPAMVTRPMPTRPDWPDLVYIDSGLAHRARDITLWLTNGYTGPVLVHDADRQYPELRGGSGVYLPTANGMWLGRGK